MRKQHTKTVHTSPSFEDALGVLKKDICPSLERILNAYYQCVHHIMTEVSDPELLKDRLRVVERLDREQSKLLASMKNNVDLIETIVRLSNEHCAALLEQQALDFDQLLNGSVVAVAIDRPDLKKLN